MLYLSFDIKFHSLDCFQYDMFIIDLMGCCSDAYGRSFTIFYRFWFVYLPKCFIELFQLTSLLLLFDKNLLCFYCFLCKPFDLVIFLDIRFFDEH